MMSGDERKRDVIEVCNVLLEKLGDFPQTDSTPEGRMVSQLRWLKERAEAGELDLPVDPRYIGTLRYVYTEGALAGLSESYEEYVREIEVPLYRLMALTKDGSLLAKRSYYPYAARCVNKLVNILTSPQSRTLSPSESAALPELEALKEKLKNEEIEPPVLGWRKSSAFGNFRKVYSLAGSSIDDLPKAKEITRLVVDFVFNGKRPASWDTPEAADQQTAFSD